MPFGGSLHREPGVLRLTRGERPSVLERVVLLVIVAAAIALDLFGLVTAPEADPLVTVFSIAATAALALYLWSPLAATCALALVVALSYFAGNMAQVMMATAFSAGLVTRLGWTSLILSYTGGFLVACAVIAYGGGNVPVNVGIYLFVAVISGAIGFALRLAFARGRRLEQELEERAEQERQAVLAERRWIAGELHDSIAHHLTVVAMHVQLLDDPSTSRPSREAIRVAARKAMADLRFVIELADDGPRSSGPQTGDLASAVEEAMSEFEDAGHSVTLIGDLRDERIPRAAEIILARIMRESATNILKYAGAGEVGIRLDIDDETARLEIRSPLPQVPRRDLPSSGTGLNRMAERVLGASGAFSAGEVDGQWQVSARLPVA